MTLPSIGSLSMLPAGGRLGVVVGAQAIGAPADGRQLMALRIKTEAPAPPPRPATIAPAPAKIGPSQKTDDERAPPSAPSYAELDADARAAVDRLRQRDQQVRQEETAHAAVAGDLAGPISYIYQRGPDGRLYAVGGSVPIKAQAVSGDPAEARRLGARMAAAAHAATNPSGADMAAARKGYGLQSEQGGSDRTSGRAVDVSA